jgi:hypothetical protein
MPEYEEAKKREKWKRTFATTLVLLYRTCCIKGVVILYLNKRSKCEQQWFTEFRVKTCVAQAGLRVLQPLQLTKIRDTLDTCRKILLTTKNRIARVQITHQENGLGMKCSHLRQWCHKIVK